MRRAACGVWNNPLHVQCRMAKSACRLHFLQSADACEQKAQELLSRHLYVSALSLSTGEGYVWRSRSVFAEVCRVGAGQSLGAGLCSQRLTSTTPADCLSGLMTDTLPKGLQPALGVRRAMRRLLADPLQGPAFWSAQEEGRCVPDQELGQCCAATLGLDTRCRTGYRRTVRGDSEGRLGKRAVGEILGRGKA